MTEHSKSMRVTPWPFMTGITMGGLIGVAFAAPLFGVEVSDASATMLGSALGAAAAVFGAFWLQRHEAAEHRLEKAEQDKVRAWRQLLLIHPLVRRLDGQMIDYKPRLEHLRGKSVGDDYYDQIIKVNVEPLAAMLTDVDALGRSLAWDLLNLVAWGRELDKLLDLVTTRSRGMVLGDANLTEHGILEVIDVVAGCAKGAADELERLRLKFQDETAALEQKPQK